LKLSQDGVSCELWEATDRVGGRLRTDHVDGFLLDHGFQVLLTAYPACRELLDYESLQLGRFQPGAMIRFNGGFARLVDPWRQPMAAVRTTFSRVGTLRDKLRIARLRQTVRRGSLADLWKRPQETTRARLERLGFQPPFIERFFRPFLGGIFLERRLETSSRIFEFVFRMFTEGDAALPASGMQAIPQQLAARLPAGTLHFQRTAKRVDAGQVICSEGNRHPARVIIVATEAPTAAQLLDRPLPVSARRTTCLYFAAPSQPLADKLLILAGDEPGPINNVSVISNVQPSYAPPGRALISVTLVDWEGEPMAAEPPVRNQLRTWFGAGVDQWQHLRTFHIPYALPVQSLEICETIEKPSQIAPGILVCGDWCDTASIQGALESGGRAAEMAIKYLRSQPSV
jgi:phytoene dehydrogenase-like protein